MTLVELNKAYPALKREWPGRVMRMHMPQVPGFPDFLLTYGRRVFFAEVKALPGKLRPRQCAFLDELQKEGQYTCTLGYSMNGIWSAWKQGYMGLYQVKLYHGMGQMETDYLHRPNFLEWLCTVEVAE